MTPLPNVNLADGTVVEIVQTSNSKAPDAPKGGIVMHAFWCWCRVKDETGWRSLGMGVDNASRLVGLRSKQDLDDLFPVKKTAKQ